MKALKWLAMISSGIGLVLVLLGSVSAIFHLHLLRVNYMVSYFWAANSFFLITIVILLFLHYNKSEK